MSPHLEYASVAWDSHYIKDVRQLEGIQKKATWVFTGNRERAGWPDIQILVDLECLPALWYKVQRMNILHKAQTGEIAILFLDHVLVQQWTTSNHKGKRIIPVSTSTDTYKYSFWPRTITAWNTTPRHHAGWAVSLQAYCDGSSDVIRWSVCICCTHAHVAYVCNQQHQITPKSSIIMISIQPWHPNRSIGDY